jgi:hypothetical protein
MFPRLAIVVMCLLLAMWAYMIHRGQLVARESYVSRDYNDLCEVGIARPYEKLLLHMKRLADDGRSDELRAVIRRAEEQSNDLSRVWRERNPSLYRKQVDSLCQ